MFKGAYLGKLLRIDLESEQYREENIPDEFFRRYLGGRGIAAYYYYQELNAQVDPLSPENKLFFFTGPLTGLNLPSTTKFQCATRSPETGIYLCSNGGGDFGPYLKRQGYDGLIIEGKARRPLYLTIGEGGVQFRDASQLVNLKTEDTHRTITRDWGQKRTAVMSAGPAAFNGVRYANIMIGDRSFGRGGGGGGVACETLKAIEDN